MTLTVLIRERLAPHVRVRENVVRTALVSVPQRITPAVVRREVEKALHRGERLVGDPQATAARGVWEAWYERERT